jgi:hypothetical protein
MNNQKMLNEAWHFLRFLTREQEEQSWADILPSREVEQEILGAIDGDESVPQ